MGVEKAVPAEQERHMRGRIAGRLRVGDRHPDDAWDWERALKLVGDGSVSGTGTPTTPLPAQTPPIDASTPILTRHASNVPDAPSASCLDSLSSAMPRPPGRPHRHRRHVRAGAHRAPAPHRLFATGRTAGVSYADRSRRLQRGGGPRIARCRTRARAADSDPSARPRGEAPVIGEPRSRAAGSGHLT